MKGSLTELSWVDVDQASTMLASAIGPANSVQSAAMQLADSFRSLSRSCVLSRVFLIVPAGKLPKHELAWATDFATKLGHAAPLAATTPVLTLLGTAGVEPSWNDRTVSAGHRAIPLLDREFIAGAPMISALLQSLSVQIDATPSGAIQLKAMPIASNARFFVEDGATAEDVAGRPIIGARDFVEKYGIRSVFGMGGSYFDGQVVAAICFTSERLTVQDTDRFTPLLSAFKIATTPSVRSGRIF